MKKKEEQRQGEMRRQTGSQTGEWEKRSKVKKNIWKISSDTINFSGRPEPVMNSYLKYGLMAKGAVLLDLEEILVHCSSRIFLIERKKRNIVRQVGKQSI